MDYTLLRSILQDSQMTFVLGMIAFASLFFVWMAYSRIRIEKKIKESEKKIQLLELEVEIFRDRDRANLNTVRKVVDGIDDVVKKMKVALDDEEEKLKLIEVNRKELARASLQNNKGK